MPIQKSGSTAWKRAFAILIDKITGEYISRASGNVYKNGTLKKVSHPSGWVHRGAFWGKSGVGFFPSFKKGPERNRAWREFYKMIFVRDPMTRLVSAYRAKILEAHDYNIHNFRAGPSKYIYKHYRHSNETNVLKMPITFEELVNHTADMCLTGGRTNNHWDTLQKRAPCKVPWDFIGKCRRIHGTKPLSESILFYCSLDPLKQTPMEF